MALNQILQELGTTIYDAFVLPGNYVLSKITTLSPEVAATLGILGDDRPIVLLVVLSLLAWLLLALVVCQIIGFWQGLVRIVSSASRVIVYRISQAAGNLKSRLICKFRQMFPLRSRDVCSTSEVELDDLDLAVLRSAAARGPGFTTSAPEIAEQLPLRPAQIQRSLDKLRGIQMLEYVIGSTDGFDNYRLSRLGTAFLSKWQRQGAGS